MLKEEGYTIRKEGPRHWRIYHNGVRTSYSGDTYEEVKKIVLHLEQTRG